MPKHFLFRTIFFLILISPLFLSCKNQDKGDLLTGIIGHSDYEDILTVEGFVESVSSVNLMTPPRMEGQLVFLIKDGTYVKPGDVIAILKNNELQEDYDNQLLSIQTMEGNLTKTKANLEMEYAQLDAQVQNNNVQTQISSLDSLQIKYASPVDKEIKELQLQKVAIEKRKLDKKLKALEIINKNQLIRMQLQIQSQRSRLESIKQQLDNMTIKATQEGMAMRAVSWITGKTVQEGETVWSNMPLAVIPDMNHMKVRIMASEAHFKRMDEGNPVEYSFDAMPGNAGTGKITMKTPVGTPVSPNSTVKFFEVQASMDKVNKTPVPGMSVTCNVVLKRIKDTIVVPQVTLFDEDSARFVYVFKQKGYERREVVVGISSPEKAIIVKGLNGSERLSLIKPDQERILNTVRLPRVLKKRSKAEKKVPAPAQINTVQQNTAGYVQSVNGNDISINSSK